MIGVTDILVKEKRIDIGIKAFIIFDGLFLVMHNYGEKRDLWELPGGRMEFGETAEETVIRELKEETGLLVKPLKLMDTWDHIEDDYQITGIIYLCSINGGDVRLSQEHDAYKWVPVNSGTVNIMYDAFKIRMEKWDWGEFL